MESIQLALSLRRPVNQVFPWDFVVWTSCYPFPVLQNLEMSYFVCTTARPATPGVNNQVKPKYKSPAKRIRNIKRLLTYMLAKMKPHANLSIRAQTQISIEPSYEELEPVPQFIEPNVPPQQVSHSITLEEFERLTKSVSQETQQRREEERQRRQEERNIDLKKFRTLLSLPPE